MDNQREIRFFEPKLIGAVILSLVSVFKPYQIPQERRNPRESIVFRYERGKEPPSSNFLSSEERKQYLGT